MRVEPIKQPTFKGYTIKAEDNKHVKYLYNEVQDAIYKQGISATFTNIGINLGRLTEAVQKRLKELKIVFTKDEK